MTRREWIRRISRLDRKRPLVKRASILGIHSLSLPPFVCITLGKSSYGPTVEGGPVMLARHHRHSVLTMMNDVQNVGPSFLLFIFSSVFFFLPPWQSVLQATSRGQQDGSELLAALQLQSGGNSGTNNGQSLQLPSFAKRQGVSGESSDQHNHHHKNHQHNRQANNQQADLSLLVTSHDKDFR